MKIKIPNATWGMGRIYILLTRSYKLVQYEPLLLSTKKPKAAVAPHVYIGREAATRIPSAAEKYKG